eukprot:6906108-Lingulodinium_polyedra.AAC.1
MFNVLTFYDLSFQGDAEEQQGRRKRSAGVARPCWWPLLARYGLIYMDLLVDRLGTGGRVQLAH